MIFRPSGGALYHWRAWANQTRWRAFTDPLAIWLEQWSETWATPPQTLILVGSSGGYTLPTAWLNKFKRIDAFDLDPLAPFFFKRRHRNVPVTFHRTDLLRDDQAFSARLLVDWLHAHPDTAVLFSNVLGQLLLETAATEVEWTKFLRDLRLGLESYPWASYHDAFSEVRRGAEIVRTDHLTRGTWCEGLPTRELTWTLDARTRHVVDAIFKSP